MQRVSSHTKWLQHTQLCIAVTGKSHTKAEHGQASYAYPELPCCFLQAPHLVEGQATAAAQDTAGWVDGAAQLKVAQSLGKLLLLHHDLAQAIPSGTHTGTRGHVSIRVTHRSSCTAAAH